VPKPKPDQVIRHEIVLGRSDRELLETAVIARNANSLLETVVKAMSDVSFLVAVGGLLAAYGIVNSDEWESLKGLVLGAGSETAETAAELVGGLADLMGTYRAEKAEVKEEGVLKYSFDVWWDLFGPIATGGRD
jgi:hypothetical protein